MSIAFRASANMILYFVLAHSYFAALRR